jgi:hypothetical protein
MDILSLLSSRKNPIVLDIGSAVTKCGYAGDAEPRLLPTEFVTTSGKRVRSTSLVIPLFTPMRSCDRVVFLFVDFFFFVGHGAHVWLYPRRVCS